MPTAKPRVTITMSREELERIDAYRFDHKMKNQTQAILALINSGLRELNLETGKKTAPLYSSEALQVAKDYDGLDQWGRETVRVVIDAEQARCADEKRFLDDLKEPEEERIINLFDEGAAAGLALGQTGQGATPYVLGPDDPRGAAYAIRVSGNSMEPYFPDGSIAFVNHDEMRDGDIGVFCVDGATVIKQWYYDPVLGMTYLFSLNRSRADADLIITRSSGISLVWQGRVLTKQRYDLPGM